MTPQTKQRIQQRLQQILNNQEQTPKTIDDIEIIALTIGEELKQAALEEVAQEVQDEQRQEGEQGQEKDTQTQETNSRTATKLPCPQCQKNAWFKGKREKKIQTRAGILTLKRDYYHCNSCHQGFFPIDEELQIQQQKYTRSFEQEVAALCTCMPYELAMKTLNRLTALHLSGRSAQRLCIKEVAPIVSDYLKERLEAAEQEAPPPGEAGTLTLQADGIHTPMRDGSWREMKVGVVRTQRGDEVSTRYISTLEPASPFGKGWEALARCCGYAKASCLSVLGDGAAWIWNLAKTHFPDARQILDFYHASTYVHAVGDDIFGKGVVSVEKESWLSSRFNEMRSSSWSIFWESIDGLCRPGLSSLSRLRVYFSNNSSRMDYGLYLSLGLSIGSGLAESSCKRVVTQRLKGSGMRWSVVGSEVIACLRGFLLGEEWEQFVAFWNRRALRGVGRLAASPLF